MDKLDILMTTPPFYVCTECGTEVHGEPQSEADKTMRNLQVCFTCYKEIRRNENSERKRADKNE